MAGTLENLLHRGREKLAMLSVSSGGRISRRARGLVAGADIVMGWAAGLISQMHNLRRGPSSCFDVLMVRRKA